MGISIDDQISDKSIALIIKGGKLTGVALAKAIQMFLDHSKELMQKANEPKHGKQTVKELTRQGVGVSNIEITDKNIKSFESVARKYGVDFALKKDVSETPPRWMVFFKSRDADALTAAFKEFSARQLKRTAEKPSVIEGLRNLMAMVKTQAIDKTKHKDRGLEL